jgi:hypothetical protein
MGRVTRILQASSAAQPAVREPGQSPARSPASDAELARIVAAWPHLPKHIKRAILTLVSTSAARPQ